MKKSIVLAAFLGIFFFNFVMSQENFLQSQVDYQGKPVIDSDLDGLTDQAELQFHKTDLNNPDTDNDGYYDGTEVIVGVSPLDAVSIPGMPPVGSLDQIQDEVPLAWYVSRVSGLVGFTLLYISIFLALTIRVPFMRRIFSPLHALNAHGWIALQATIFALVHGTILVFDEFMGFDLVDIFVPFAASYKPALIASGIIGFYLMLILVVTSYARKYFPFKLWRAVHFANIILYLGVIVHAYFLGTDMKNEIIRNIFVYANILLIILMLTNMFIRIRQNIARKNSITQNSTNQ